ncbi:terminase large subunit domain-containing protein [Bdellovibrio bacteriovorus]|uniref:terminase large subunit domain-containing protein n=1 Tax=Bdellovibrio bacteriovorus TaxID=959 RepID=UPI0035A5C321
MRQPIKPTLVQVQQEQWMRGNLGWKLHKAQKVIDKNFKEAKNQLFVGNCSRQFGKSFWAVCKAVEQAIKVPKSQIRYGAAFQSDLVDFIIPAFEKVMEDCPPAIKGKYKSQGSSFNFPNGSKIKLVGLDKNPNGLRGNTLDLIVLDECGFVANLDYIYKSVIIPATTHRPNAKIILISTPPSTPAHAFVDYCQRAEAEGGYACFTIYDNPMIDEATIQRLMKESGGDNATTWKREYLCQFVTDSDSSIIPEWDDKYIQEVPKDAFYPFYHRYVGMDLGVKDFTAVIFGYYDFTKATLIIEDELVLNGPSLNTEILKESIVTKEQSLWASKQPYRRISDNNNLMLLNDLTTLHNLTFMPTNKDTLEAMINEVRLMVQAGRIIISPKCKLTVGSLKYGVWDSKRTGFARSTTYGHFDCLAALIYLVRNLDKYTNPIPPGYGTAPETHWVPSSTATSHQANELKKLFSP